MNITSSRIDQFLLIHAGRADAWRSLTHLSESWARGAGGRGAVEESLAALAPTEVFHAYPGPRLLTALSERIASDDAAGVSRLVRRISNALLTRSYRSQAGDWEPHAEQAPSEVADALPLSAEEGGAARPYFEALFVISQPASRWPAG